MNILIVEDSLLERLLLSYLLSNGGLGKLTIKTCDSVESAKRVCVDFFPEIVLLDLTLSYQEDYPFVLTQIPIFAKFAKVVVISGTFDITGVSKAVLDAGAVKFISKICLRPQALVEDIKEVCALPSPRGIPFLG